MDWAKESFPCCLKILQLVFTLKARKHKHSLLLLSWPERKYPNHKMGRFRQSPRLLALKFYNQFHSESQNTYTLSLLLLSWPEWKYLHHITYLIQFVRQWSNPTLEQTNMIWPILETNFRDWLTFSSGVFSTGAMGAMATVILRKRLIAPAVSTRSQHPQCKNSINTRHP